MKALKNKHTKKIILVFPQSYSEFTDPDHELITVAINEINSSLCADCSKYDVCSSGIKGNDHDCSSYVSNADHNILKDMMTEKEPIG